MSPREVGIPGTEQGRGWGADLWEEGCWRLLQASDQCLMLSKRTSIAHPFHAEPPTPPTQHVYQVGESMAF